MTRRGGQRPHVYIDGTKAKFIVQENVWHSTKSKSPHAWG